MTGKRSQIGLYIHISFDIRHNLLVSMPMALLAIIDSAIRLITFGIVNTSLVMWFILNMDEWGLYRNPNYEGGNNA